MRQTVAILTILAAAAVVGCDSRPTAAAVPKAEKQAGAAVTSQTAEPEFYPLLRRRLTSNPDRRDAAEASWELLHPKVEDKTDPTKKKAYIDRHIASAKSSRSFSQIHCDKPHSILKTPPAYDGNYAHVTTDVMCGAFLMRTVTDTLEKVDGKWYWVRVEVNATYVDPKAGQLKASL